MGPKGPATVAGPACRGRSLLSKEGVPRLAINLTVVVVGTVRAVLAACHMQHIKNTDYFIACAFPAQILPVSASVQA